MDYIGKSIFANYFRGIEAVGGKLYFDEQGILFRSHALNIQTGDTRICYAAMEKAQKRGILTGMSIFTKDGFEHKFVVYHRKRVIAFLESQIKNCTVPKDTALSDGRKQIHENLARRAFP